MYPLIEIKTVPIEIEMKTTHAKLEHTSGTAEMEISRSDSGVSIRSRAICLNMDTFEARNALLPRVTSPANRHGSTGIPAEYAATASYASPGRLLLTTRLGQELGKPFAAEAQMTELNTNIGAQPMPSTGSDIAWEAGEMRIRYEIDKLNFDWHIEKGDFTFTPGDIKISVTQRPDVIIKYVGGQIYVPRSAAPNYEPMDVRV